MTINRFIKWTIFAFLSLLVLQTAKWMSGAKEVMYVFDALYAMSLTAVHLKLNARRETLAIEFQLIMLTCLTWAISDVLFITIDKAQHHMMYWLAYSLPNVLIALSALVFFWRNVKPWNWQQLTLNLVTTMAVISISVWGTIVHHFLPQALTLLENINLFVYLVLDAIAISVIFVLFASARIQKVSIVVRLFVVSILLFALTDMGFVIYDALSRREIYHLADSFFMIALTLMTVANALHFYFPQFTISAYVEEVAEVMQRTNRVRILFAVVLLFLLMTGSGLLIISLTIGVIFFHEFMSAAVSAALRNRYLLVQEKQEKDELEEKVAQRTSELRETNQHLQWLMYQDALTQLHNRRHFMDQLDALIADESCETFSVLYMDLDRFKIINDSHGHEVGDYVLSTLAKRLQQTLSRHYMARLGGDEFVIVIVNEGERAVAKLAERIVELCEQPIDVSPYTFKVGVSIGIASYPEHSTTRSELVKFADMTMYEVKRDYYKRRYRFFTEQLNEKLVRRNEIELLLRTVNYDNEFVIYYQPQFSMTGELIGAEALLRWFSREKGFISPAEFIPIAEEIGVIVTISEWVMRGALRQVAAWNAARSTPLTISLNLSPKQLDDPQFLTEFDVAVRELQVAPHWIDLELTEGYLMSNQFGVEHMLNELKARGVMISIDDFGTGYSSLSYVRKFNVDRLKIAKELIDDLLEDELIVKAIVMMAKGLGVKTIAEGVETEARLAKLYDLQCDEIQGFYLGRPVDAHNFAELYMKETKP